MNNWFEVKARFEKILENGTIGKVTETYLFDALSYSEAEKRAQEELKPYISGEFEIIDIKRPRIAELFFNENGDYWYSAKLNLIFLDEVSGMEKKKYIKVLVKAVNLEDAIYCIKEEMKNTLSDYVFSEVKETAIMDVFPYKTDV